ncbi:MAG: hypothetical protein NTV34_12915 [Proteobacteria bacterium]|nr:hypothetical protein [Pseudomonadota bacterium]
MRSATRIYDKNQRNKKDRESSQGSRVTSKIPPYLEKKMQVSKDDLMPDFLEARKNNDAAVDKFLADLGNMYVRSEIHIEDYAFFIIESSDDPDLRKL